MKHRRVRLDVDARSDLRHIYRWIAMRGAPVSGRRYLDRIVAFAKSLDLAPERGIALTDIRPALRAIQFEGVVLAVLVEDDSVVVLRVFHGSQDWPALLRSDQSGTTS